MRSKKIVANVLLAFVLISIGYALGREMTLRSSRVNSAAGSGSDTDHMVVYYFHGAIRCVTCNAIERMTREVVHRDFARQLEQGTLRWKVDNFQENESLARKYDLSTSTVVLSRIQDGREVAFTRLDKVWELSHEPQEFQEFIRQSINAMTKGDRP